MTWVFTRLDAMIWQTRLEFLEQKQPLQFGLGKLKIAKNFINKLGLVNPDLIAIPLRRSLNSRKLHWNMGSKRSGTNIFRHKGKSRLWPNGRESVEPLVPQIH